MAEEAEASDEEEERENVAEVMGNLIIETARTEEEAAEGLVSALGMEIEEDMGGEGEEGGKDTQRALGAL